MAKAQRLGKNSITKVAQMAIDTTDYIPLPDGVLLRSDEELLIWHQFTRTRTREDWRDFDLLLLAKTVRLEADIRKHQAELDRLGAITTNDRGTPIANPYLSVIDSLQRQQLSIIRSMNMAQTGHDPRTVAVAGKKKQELKGTFNELDDLLAKPN